MSEQKPFDFLATMVRPALKTDMEHVKRMVRDFDTLLVYLQIVAENKVRWLDYAISETPPNPAKVQERAAELAGAALLIALAVGPVDMTNMPHPEEDHAEEDHE